MAQNTLRRELGTVDYESGQVSEIELPRSHYYEKLGLLLDYDVTVGTGGSQNENGILELIDRIEVVLNGNQTLKSTSLALSHFIDRYQYAVSPALDRVDFGSATNQTGNAQTYVDFAVAPGDKSAMVPSFKTSDFVLRIKWGTASDVGDDTTVNSASLKVQSRERVRGAVANGSEQEKRVLRNLMAFKERERRQTLDTAGVSTVELPRGNVYYAVPLQVIDGDSPSNTLVDNFEVAEDGVDIHRAVDFDHAQVVDAQDYNISGPTDGFTYVNFGHRGNLNDVVDSSQMDAFEVDVDTAGVAPTAPSHVRTVTQEIIR